MMIVRTTQALRMVAAARPIMSLAAIMSLGVGKCWDFTSRFHNPFMITAIIAGSQLIPIHERFIQKLFAALLALTEY